MDAGLDVDSLLLSAAQRGLAGASGRAVWLVLEYVLAGPARSGAVFHCSGQRLAADAAGHGHHIGGAQRAAARYLRTGANRRHGLFTAAVPWGAADSVSRGRGDHLFSFILHIF